ncbi:MAG TPA: bifunctional oligoribonuclease/PAP phosphatase NrnA [Syntrophales bacterium]|nr:bifunctional oligoribonuclease/PAP phosphatase NrnA [Syntrophales bacterium]
MLHEIIEQIRQHQVFLITAHVRLDGDALGSELALYHLLCSLGKEVVVYNQDRIPDNYRFLPGSEVIVNAFDDPERYDAAFILDCSEMERVGDKAGDIAKIKRLLNIDHHISNDGFCHYSYIDPAASSTGELLYRLATAMSVPFSREMATTLYAAILTDSGGFRYSSTTKETLMAAGNLVGFGADPQWISEHIYESNPLVRIQLLGKVLETLRFDLDGRVGSMMALQKTLDALGAKLEHTENFVDVPRTIRGVDVAIFYSEMKEGLFKLSLRSKDQVNVEKVARVFGGGGHMNAAACRIEGDFTAVHQRVLDVVRSVL